MTITIVQTVTATSLAFSFTTVAAGDLAVMTTNWDHDGSAFSADIDLGSWNDLSGTGDSQGGWKLLTAGETSHSFTGSHMVNVQLIAVLLRNDTFAGVGPAVDEVATNGDTIVTDFANDAVIAWTGSDSGGYGGFTSETWALHAAMTEIACWTHVPFQVPLGTSMTITTTPESNLGYVYCFRPWGSGTPPPAGAGGWTGWIID